MVETYLSIDDTMEYYECGDFPFNFFFIMDLPRLGTDRVVEAVDMERIINLWMDNMPAGKTANWVVSTKHETIHWP
jgi:hypothetical protein